MICLVLIDSSLYTHLRLHTYHTQPQNSQTSLHTYPTPVCISTNCDIMSRSDLGELPLIHAMTNESNDRSLAQDLELRIQSELDSHQTKPEDPTKVTMSNLFEKSISSHSSPNNRSDIDNEILAERSLLTSLIDYRDATAASRASLCATSDSSNDDVNTDHGNPSGNPSGNSLTAAQRKQSSKRLFSH